VDIPDPDPPWGHITLTLKMAVARSVSAQVLEDMLTDFQGTATSPAAGSGRPSTSSSAHVSPVGVGKEVLTVLYHGSLLHASWMETAPADSLAKV